MPCSSDRWVFCSQRHGRGLPAHAVADASEMVLYYDLAVRMTDVLIGNELEITFAREAVRSGGQGGEAVAAGLRIPGAAGGTPEKQRFEREVLLATADDLVADGVEGVVVKVGAAGSFAITAGGVYKAPGFPVDIVILWVRATASPGFCSGLLHGWDWERCLTQGNAVGAVVVSRHGCAPGIPTLAELSDFLRAATHAPGHGGWVVWERTATPGSGSCSRLRPGKPFAKGGCLTSGAARR